MNSMLFESFFNLFKKATKRPSTRADHFLMVQLDQHLLIMENEMIKTNKILEALEVDKDIRFTVKVVSRLSEDWMYD